MATTLIDHLTAIATAPSLCSTYKAQAIIEPNIRIEQSSYTGRSYAALRLTQIACDGALTSTGAGTADMGSGFSRNFGAAAVGVSERAMDPAIDGMLGKGAAGFYVFLTYRIRMADLSMFANPEDARDYPAGHTFFGMGDRGDVMCVVLTGEVDILARDKVVESVGPGGIFGEMALIDNRERSAAARAKTAAKVATIDQGQFLYLLRTHPSFSIEVMNVMADRLRLLNAALL